MREVFADTSYWIALINPQDNLHQRAMDVSSQLGDFRIITSEMVFIEVLNTFAGHGSYLRDLAAKMVQSIISAASVEVVPQTRALFRDAFSLYRARHDKDWSLTDCASFVIMEQRGTTEALTHDRHFVQNGYQALLREQQ